MCVAAFTPRPPDLKAANIWGARSRWPSSSTASPAPSAPPRRSGLRLQCVRARAQPPASVCGSARASGWARVCAAAPGPGPRQRPFSGSCRFKVGSEPTPLHPKGAGLRDQSLFWAKGMTCFARSGGAGRRRRADEIQGNAPARLPPLSPLCTHAHSLEICSDGTRTGH